MMKITVIGGGAAGMTCAILLARAGKSVTVIERGERLGRKLSATGNGQGNVTNTHVDASHYFSDDADKVARVLTHFSWQDAVAFLQSMGGCDEQMYQALGFHIPLGRTYAYPAGGD